MSIWANNVIGGRVWARQRGRKKRTPHPLFKQVVWGGEGQAAAERGGLGEEFGFDVARR